MRILSRVYFLGTALTIGASAAKADIRGLTAPTLSLDGKSVAYCVYSAPEDDKYKILSSEIWVAGRDGSGAHQVTRGAKDGDIQWNPSGKQLAFRRAGDIWIVNTDGSGLKQITKTDSSTEFSPSFSNDGKSLFFVRSTLINLAEGLANEKPLYIDGPGVVVAYSLVSGQEKERFKSQDNIKRIIANRADPSEVFLLYQYYDPKAKTKYGEGGLTDFIVAAAKLDGSGRRVLKRQKPDTKPQLVNLHEMASGAIIETLNATQDEDEETFFTIPTKTGEKVVTSGDLPLAFSDISLDGGTFIGIGGVTKTVEGKLTVQPSIKFYDVATKDVTSLDRDTLLGTAPKPIVTPVTTPKTATVAPTPSKAAPVTNPPTPAASRPIPVPVQPVQPAKPPVKLPTLAELARKRFEEGEKNFKDGAIGEAIDAYTSAITLNRDYAEAYSGLAKCYAQRMEWDSAIENVNHVIRLRPTDSEAFFERADYNSIVGDNPAARADYTEAIRLAPANAKLYRARASFLRKIGDKEQADKDDQKAKELEP